MVPWCCSGRTVLMAGPLRGRYGRPARVIEVIGHTGGEHMMIRFASPRLHPATSRQAQGRSLTAIPPVRPAGRGGPTATLGSLQVLGDGLSYGDRGPAPEILDTGPTWLTLHPPERLPPAAAVDTQLGGDSLPSCGRH